MNILIIDAQGGGLGRALITQLKQSLQDVRMIAVGTNSAATSAMIKAGADICATGENAILYNCKKCSSHDIIVGPIGILLSNSMYGEISPAMAKAVCESDAKKVVIPSARCNVFVTGNTGSMSISSHISQAVQQIIAFQNDETTNGEL